jgi:hypothetical protein
VQAGYILVHTAQRLSGTCFEAALFLSILTGEIVEDAYLQSRSVLQSLLEFQVAAGECHLDFCKCAIFVLRYESQTFSATEPSRGAMPTFDAPPCREVQNRDQHYRGSSEGGPALAASHLLFCRHCDYDSKRGQHCIAGNCGLIRQVKAAI